MAGFWSVIIPSQTAITNMVTNPSLETTTDGWDAKSGGTYAASTTRARRGYKSLAYTPTTNTTDGVFYDAVALTSGTNYTAAFDFWGADTIPFTAYWATTAGSTVDDTAITWTASAQWTRKAVTYAATASANFRLYVTKNSSASTAIFYVDGIGVYATTYDPGHIDGDQEDCYWSGTAHASTSVAKAGSRLYGEETNFDNYAFYVESWPGAGMPVIESLTQPISLLPGVQDYGEKVRERTFDIVGTLIGTSQTNLHYARQQLINALKSDLVRDKQQFWLTFSGANSSRPTRIRAKYTGGMTFGRQEGFSERLGLRFQATEPFWHEDGMEGASLTLAASASADYASKRVSGTWSNIAVFNQIVLAIVQGKDGMLYIGGSFTDIGDANGDYIIKYNPVTGAVSSLGTGMNGEVDALAVAPNGDIYAAGAFTSAGGVANTARIAYWNGSAWNPLSTGIGSGVAARLVFGQDGILYVGGTFTNHVDANGDFITQWDGAAFSSLGTGANLTSVNSLAIAKNGNLIAGGDFTQMGGVTNTAYIAEWDGTAWTALGTGMNGGVYGLAVGEDGTLYAAGAFSTAGGVAADAVAKWNGITWSPMGSGTIGGDPYRLFIDSDGLLYVTGTFTSMDGLSTADGIAVWNGSTWAHLGLNLPGTSTVYIILKIEDDLYIGTSTTGTGAFSAVNTITNSGTAISYPKITVKCTTMASTDDARVELFRNDTTGATLWMDYSLQEGETLTIDCSPSKRSITSSFFGNVIGRALLRPSDFSQFYLLPGANSISAYVYQSGAPAITGSMTWPITHWACDGSAT